MRSSKFDPRRQPLRGTLSKRIVTALILAAVVTFLVLVIAGTFR